MGQYDDVHFEIEQLLDEDETIYWKGKPLKKPLAKTRISRMKIGLVCMVFIPLFVLTPFFILLGLNGWEETKVLCYFFFPFIGLCEIIIGSNVIPSFFNAHIVKKCEFMVTDKRVIVKNVLINKDSPITYYYHDILSVSVTVDKIDHKYGAGTVNINSNNPNRESIYNNTQTGVYVNGRNIAREPEGISHITEYDKVCQLINHFMEEYKQGKGFNTSKRDAIINGTYVEGKQDQWKKNLK